MVSTKNRSMRPHFLEMVRVRGHLFMLNQQLVFNIPMIDQVCEHILRTISHSAKLSNTSYGSNRRLVNYL